MVDYSGWGKCTIIMGNTDTQAAAERVEPVFFLNSDVEQEDGNYLTVFEVCSAASEIVTGGSGGVDGAQRIWGALENLPEKQTRSHFLTIQWHKPEGLAHNITRQKSLFLTKWGEC